VEVAVPPSLPPVLGDPDRLGQVFANLVDNALKHARRAPGGGLVRLQAESHHGRVVCSVMDNGPGIPAEDLGRIFERFYQVDKSRARRGAGVGLGLAIAREIVQAHGGQIDVESVEGLGTRFTVMLPATFTRV
jgi:two-component system phosphate regulon sensor histidine kinase PhoR